MSVILFSSVVAAALGAGLAGAAAQHDQHAEKARPATSFEVPDALKVEHEALHRELSAATKLAGKTGPAAERVAKLLHAHFVSEEEFALPPLGLLVPLARGPVTADMRKVTAMTDRLKADLPRMLEEHKAIVGALDDLERAAKAEGHPEAVEFTHKLKPHARNEEQVLYPAAILVGEYVKMKSAK